MSQPRKLTFSSDESEPPVAKPSTREPITLSRNRTKLKSFRPQKNATPPSEEMKMRPSANHRGEAIDLEARRKIKGVGNYRASHRRPLKIDSPSTSDLEWENPKSQSSPKPSPDRFIVRTRLVAALVLVAVLVVALAFWFQMKPSSPQIAATPEEDPQEEAPLFANQNPKEIAQAFVDEADPQQRLQFVRNPDKVQARMHRYPAQALSEPVEELTEIPMIHVGDLSYARFAAQFTNGDMRLLTIVSTPDGPKVDWDCYARYTDAPWDEILTGEATSPEVRTFAKVGSYYNFDYRDEEQWTCYSLSSPDTDDVIYAYLPRSSEKNRTISEALAQQDINQASNRFTFRLKTHPTHPGRKQFLIDEILATGWVKTISP